MKFKLFNQTRPNQTREDNNYFTNSLSIIKEDCGSVLSGSASESNYISFLSNLEKTNCETENNAIHTCASTDKITSDDTTNTLTPSQIMSTSRRQTVMDKYIKEAIQKSGYKLLEDATDPITMDIRTVIQMIQEFKIEMKEEIAEQIRSSIQTELQSTDST